MSTFFTVTFTDSINNTQKTQLKIDLIAGAVTVRPQSKAESDVDETTCEMTARHMFST